MFPSRTRPTSLGDACWSVASRSSSKQRTNRRSIRLIKQIRRRRESQINRGKLNKGKRSSRTESKTKHTSSLSPQPPYRSLNSFSLAFEKLLSNVPIVVDVGFSFGVVGFVFVHEGDIKLAADEREALDAPAVLRKTGAEVDLMRLRGGAGRDVVIVDGTEAEVEVVGVEDGALARKGVEREDEVGLLVDEVGVVGGTLGLVVDDGAEVVEGFVSESMTVAQICFAKSSQGRGSASERDHASKRTANNSPS